MDFKILLALALVFVTACSQSVTPETNVEAQENNNVESQQNLENKIDWINFELFDINSNSNYKISDFKGKTVLVESFAVWCPLCTKQQVVSKELHEELGDSIVAINIDTDPNEDEAAIKAHADENGFDWYYSVSPIEFTKSLIDEFGNGVVSAPSVPMILVCEDGNYRMLGRGVKSAETIKDEIAKGCNL
ncbi:redoxin family protein [archaeon]|jgi:thiol-disulfide isomerase/thioredoxin|nr:redoxin family protein [archaeon]MBT4272401.1 redoxin family protein [archaeon]MBT4460690.1 redoxin family protein [archaeon]MBT5423519.1 redoxin family protein [archaeon]MBT6772815.1 redoxin family protein [archaeon]